MKKFLINLCLLCLIWIIVPTLQAQVKLTPMKGLKQQTFMYQEQNRMNPEGHMSGFSPTFLIYPNQRVDEAGALALIQDLGIDQLIPTQATGVGVVNPLGDKYDNRLDLEAYKTLIDSMKTIANLKIIGIGNGATFVNQTIANCAYEVAGIVSINGKAGKVSPEAVPVPAFVSGGASTAIVKQYNQINHTNHSAKNAHLIIYTNNDEPLQRVVASQGKKQSLKDIFTDAWNSLLNKNYRFHNTNHTWYTGAKFGQYGTYELEPFLLLDELSVKRNIVLQEQRNGEKWLWYEYLPEGTEVAVKNTIPLFLLLHGNTNDPRTQAETSGLIEVAAKEHFIVAELEWQGNGYGAMGLDGIENVVYQLLAKYPQIDPSRIYTEGLSAGSMTSTQLGIRKSYIFAGVGAMSGGIFRSNIFYGSEGVFNDALQKRGAVEMAYYSITGTDDEVVRFVKPGNYENSSIYTAWQAYQTMNGLEISKGLDFSKDATFGIELQQRKTIQTNKGISVEEGVLCKGDVPLMKLVAVNNYGHWNFKPAAQMMWDYLKHFSRDVETKKLIYTP